MKRANILDIASRRHYRTLPSFHSILRAIPELQKLEMDTRLLIVGEPKGVSYGAPDGHGKWKDRFLKEVEGKYNLEGVIFTGKVP